LRESAETPTAGVSIAKIVCSVEVAPTEVKIAIPRKSPFRCDFAIAEIQAQFDPSVCTCTKPKSSETTVRAAESRPPVFCSTEQLKPTANFCFGQAEAFRVFHFTLDSAARPKLSVNVEPSEWLLQVSQAGGLPFKSAKD
jgi:hypothetical protein